MNDRRAIFDRVKRATVALAFIRKTPGPRNRPFEVLGSGFCVDSRGVIVTCRHVIEAFMAKSAAEQIAQTPESEKGKPIRRLDPGEVIPPQVLFFYQGPQPHLLFAAQIQARLIVAKTDRDLACIRIDQHEGFRSGYPYLEIEDPNSLFDGAEVATCGFPLGSYLGDQIGTITSSFTRGIISSILPAAGAPREHIEGYQLDLTATHGNSGGPVFALESGRVFGVLERGVFQGDGQSLLPGITKAEAVYPLFEDGSIQRLRDAALPTDGSVPPPPGDGRDASPSGGWATPASSPCDPSSTRPASRCCRAATSSSSSRAMRRPGGSARISPRSPFRT